MPSSEHVVGYVRLTLRCLLHRGSYKVGKVLIALCVVRKQFPVVHLRIDTNLVDLLLLGVSSHQRFHSYW